MGTESPTGAPGGGGFDINSINRNDLGVMIAGLVALIASFFPFVGIDTPFGDASDNAWRSYAVLGLLLLFAAAILIALKTFTTALPSNLPIGLHVAAAAMAALGTLLLILHAFTAKAGPIELDPKWGAWVLFVAGIAVTVFAVLGMRESGEKIPDFRGGGSTPPAPPPPPPAP